MPIVYRIYSNAGTGGPVDYASPVATATGLSATVGPLSPSGDYRYAVRAMDAATGIEEANTQATVGVTLDAAGLAVGPRPNAPFAAFARPTPGGGCRVAWAYGPAGQAAAPAAFLVYLTAGPAPDLAAAPAASVAYRPGISSYSCPLAGLVDGAAYTVAVVAQGGAGLGSSPAATATALGDATPPEDVDALAAVAVP